MVRKLLTLTAVLALTLMPLNLAFGTGSVYAQDDGYDSTLDDWNWESDTWDDVDYTYTYEDELDPEVAAAVFIVYMGFIACISLVSFIYMGLVFSTIAKKLNEENRWMAWVPVVSTFYMVKLAGMNPWLGLLLCLPGVNLVVAIIVLMKIAERRGFESWLGLLMLVPVVNFFLPAYLAWAEPKGKSAMTESKPDEPKAPTPVSETTE